ncbi:MAG TPA: thioredoxin family protein [Chitinophagales bacterium]|nr:thioredoxin family protein [Chitinophagales bacterium]
MKHLIIAVIAALSFNVTAQEQTLTWQTDVMKAVDLSVKTKKPLFLFFTGSDWCGWCKRLQAEVFTQPQFQAWAKKNVVLVELDFPRFKRQDERLQKQNIELAQIFGIGGYPTVVFATPTVNGTQIVFNRLGSTGYIAGGPDVWLEAANQLLTTPQ